MPRGPRLDAPGALHHVMARGIERRDIFADDRDRRAFVTRIARLAREGAWEVFAWALMPNHFHLLVRTKAQPLSRSMRRLMTGHAVAFNRRHHRVGHLFQNRYRSILCDDEAYLLELVRYIHLNPFRRGVVRTLADLERYPYTGHSALIGIHPRGWQSTQGILERFAPDGRRAVASYREFVAGGASFGRRPDFLGGGLVRVNGGWKAVAELHRGREVFVSDERILGDANFVRAVLNSAQPRKPENDDRTELERLIVGVCRARGLAPAIWSARSRKREATAAKDAIAFLWTRHLGRSAKRLAAELGIHPTSICRAADRGQKEAARRKGRST